MQQQKDNQKSRPSQNNRLLWLYAGFAFQLLAALAIGVYVGLKLDARLKPGMPLLVWLLPLLIIIALIIKVVKDTGKQK